MTRRRFWPSENMRVAAFRAMQSRNLKMTLEIKKALRYHYQMLADMGKFKSPTTAELQAMGVDTTSWNEGKGYLPPDIAKKEARLLANEIEIEPEEDGQASIIQKPHVTTNTVHDKIVKDIVNSGPGFSKPKEIKEEKPAPTFRKWKGEHYDPVARKWESKDGFWWNPVHENKVYYDMYGDRKIKVKGAWEPGEPHLGLFYWSFEFVWDPNKYDDPVPYGEFHLEISKIIEQIKRVVLLVGRDHLKTTFFNVNDMLWRICEFPDKAKMGLLNIAWDPGLAEVTFMEVVENLTQNEKILSFYGYLIDDSRPKTQERIYFIYQPIGAKFGLRCTSFKSGSITGSHPWKVYIDDPEDEQLSETYMEKFQRIIIKKLLPAVGKNGIIQVTGTIKGYDKTNDGYLWLETNRIWTVMRYPAANEMPPMKDVIFDLADRECRDSDGNFIRLPDGSVKTEKYYDVEVKDRDRYKVLYHERFTIEDLVVKRLEMSRDGKSDDDFWSEYFLQAVNPSGKYFLKGRVKPMPPPGYLDTRSFVDYCHENHEPIYLWVDPGGASSHGIAIAVGVKLAGRYYFLDFIVVRAGLPETAQVISRLIVEWGISSWGCEGNFNQAECFGRTLDREVYNYMLREGWSVYYSPCIIQNNTGEKFQRIATHLSNMIGLDGTDITFYVNMEAKDFDLFARQIGTFGAGIKKSREHEYDLLDCAASIKIHLFNTAESAICIAV